MPALTEVKPQASEQLSQSSGVEVRFIRVEQVCTKQGKLQPLGVRFLPGIARLQGALPGRSQPGAAAAGLRLPLLSAARAAPLGSAGFAHTSRSSAFPGIWSFVGHTLNLSTVRATLKLLEKINKEITVVINCLRRGKGVTSRDFI